MSVRKYTSNRRKCRFFMSVIVHNSPNMIRCEIIQILILNVNKLHRKMCWDYISSSFVKCQHPWTLIPSHEHCRNNKCCFCPLLIKYRTWLTKYEDFQEWGRQMCSNEYLMSARKSMYIQLLFFSVMWHVVGQLDPLGNPMMNIDYNFEVNGIPGTKFHYLM